jgi:Iron-containing redox enzyme
MVAITVQAHTSTMPPVAFGSQAQQHVQHYAGLSERELFYCLINADEFPSVWPYAQQRVMQAMGAVQAMLAESAKIPQHLHAFHYSCEAFSDRMAALHQHQLDNTLPVNPPSTEQLHYLLKQYAPSALLDGCWLQNISLAATNHTEITAQLFHLYAEKIGDGDTTKHYGKHFQDLLYSARIYLPEVNSRLFSVHTAIDTFAFAYPVFQLALSLFPRVYLPELLGFTLGHFFSAPDRLLVAFADEFSQRGWDTRYCQHYALADSPSATAQRSCDAVMHYLENLSDESERQQHWQRIWQGLLAHKVLSEPWQRDLQDAIATPRTLTPQQKMLAMVREKAPHARNMHRNRKLGGCPINDWFAQDPFDAEGFLQALAASPFINAKAPLESALLTRSISFGGPMFRIFTEAEQAIMAEWADSLAGQSEAPQTVGTLVNAPALCQPPTVHFQHDDRTDLVTYAKCSKRELYYYFVNADLYPDVLPTARKIAQQYFKQAKKNLTKRGLPEQLRLFPYSHDAFQARIQHIYSTETSAYEAFVSPSTVPREIMVWFTQQYAPFPMVDGSWVQHIAKAGTSQTEISARLFRIYSDEVGNADTVLNHPNVYRKLLEKEGIHMPPTDTLAFAMQPTLRNFAFDLPLLTLSVSLFPKAFLPEIIGVNLAIELSGLGKSYMQIIDELRYWKMDPYFFTLHLTIDNIASGHTAVAMETVHLYLDQVLASQGHQTMQQEWQRIWMGYVAFRQHMTRFDTTLEREAGVRFLLPLFRLGMKRRKDKKRQQAATS